MSGEMEEFLGIVNEDMLVQEALEGAGRAAEILAKFYNSLIEKGIPEREAMYLTNTFLRYNLTGGR
jgi:hypothetical protein